MRRALVTIAVLLAIVLLAPSAEAHFLWHPDARHDTPTPDLAGDLVDVRLSTFRHAGAKMLRAKADFADPKADYHVAFLFDSRGGWRADFKLRVAWDRASGGIHAMSLVRLSDHSTVDVTLHPSGKAVLKLPVWFEMGALHRTRHIRWRVITRFGDTRYDQAPDVGWFAH
ncbi:MAG: hypothetical protein ACM3OO_10340 [Planctomycetaceae bacterium]